MDDREEEVRNQGDMRMQGEQLSKKNRRDHGYAVKLGTCGVTAHMVKRQRNV